MSEPSSSFQRLGAYHRTPAERDAEAWLRRQLLVSRRLREHMSVRRQPPPPALFLNIRTMWADLQTVFDEFARELASNPTGEVPRQWKAERIEHARNESIVGWADWFQSRGREAPE
jgi:hypothetical protein